MISDNLKKIKKQLPSHVQLVVVSKFRPMEQLMEVYELGQRDFAENRVQELLSKYELMPKDIRWHMIGHLQSNKVKQIAPFIHMIHSVDSVELAIEINKQALKCSRKIPILLQVHIAKEESKFGFSIEELTEVYSKLIKLANIEIIGLMGMATFTENENIITTEFKELKTLFDKIKGVPISDNKDFQVLSMGMSSDYEIAIAEGSNLVRIGSKIFE
jgi:pyridoxal phosphate enzyme (YggS family)